MQRQRLTLLSLTWPRMSLLEGGMGSGQQVGGRLQVAVGLEVVLPVRVVCLSHS
jgi:hypothetical protein